jgi:hypothetical protein
MYSWLSSKPIYTNRLLRFTSFYFRRTTVYKVYLLHFPWNNKSFKLAFLTPHSYKKISVDDFSNMV